MMELGLKRQWKTKMIAEKEDETAWTGIVWTRRRRRLQIEVKESETWTSSNDDSIVSLDCADTLKDLGAICFAVATTRTRMSVIFTLAILRFCFFGSEV